MKKALSLVAGVALVAVLFTSCKKDYTCTCTILGSTSTSTIANSSKGDATDACDALNVSAAVLGGSCKLD